MEDQEDNYDEEEYVRKPLPDDPDETETWLLSYADLMTLLCCFFILMMVFANYDPVGFQEKSKEIAKHFDKNKFKESKSKMQKIADLVTKSIKAEDKVKVTVHESSLELTFKGGVLFKSGESRLRKEVLPMVDSMIETLQNVDPNFRIIVEGHTDGIPVSRNSIFSSNWSLSAARASSVVERFEFFGFNSNNLRPLGLAATKPVAVEKDADGTWIRENLDLNRRIILKVLLPKGNVKNLKLGLGVYFGELENEEN